jgi:TPR repeat protein
MSANKQANGLINKARRHYRLDENENAISILESPDLADCADAMLLLGQIYNGTSKSQGGVSRSIPNARKCWLKALELGNSEAALELGNLYYFDKINHKKAEEYWLFAAEAGNELAAFKLVDFYYDHRNDRINKAIELCHWLISKNEFVGNCYLKLGRIYYRGKGVPRDVAQARIWLEKGAALGHGNSCMDLALMYYLGEGVEKDVAKAIFLVETAAKTDWLNDTASLVAEKMRKGTLLH